jgi:hypothetical protein
LSHTGKFFSSTPFGLPFPAFLEVLNDQQAVV